MLIPFVAKAYVMDEEFDEVEEEAEGGEERVGQDQALATLRRGEEELRNVLPKQGCDRIQGVVAAVVGLRYVQLVHDVM